MSGWYRIIDNVVGIVCFIILCMYLVCRWVVYIVSFFILFENDCSCFFVELVQVEFMVYSDKGF